MSITVATFTAVSNCTIGTGGEAVTDLYSTDFTSNDVWTEYTPQTGQSVTFGTSGLTLSTGATSNTYNAQPPTCPYIEITIGDQDVDIVVHSSGYSASSALGAGIMYGDMTDDAVCSNHRLWSGTWAMYTYAVESGVVSSIGSLTGLSSASGYYTRLTKSGDTFSIYCGSSISSLTLAGSADLSVFTDDSYTLRLYCYGESSTITYDSFAASAGICFPEAVAISETLDAGSGNALDWSTFTGSVTSGATITYQVRESTDGETWDEWTSGIPEENTGNRYAQVRATFGNSDFSEVTLSAISVDPYALVSAPTITVDTPTNNSTPTWSWVTGGGGSGSYRYQLDSEDGDWTQTTQTSFAPTEALSHGNHTLYVQELAEDESRWSESGSALCNVDLVAPAAPTVSAEEITLDTTPTWTWASGGGGGAGTFRYQLDTTTSTWTQTTDTDYTPDEAISYGTHTLYVQEQDEAGNWSTSGAATVGIISSSSYYTQPETGDLRKLVRGFLLDAANLSDMLACSEGVYFHHPPVGVAWPCIAFDLDESAVQEMDMPGVRDLCVTVGIYGCSASLLETITAAVCEALEGVSINNSSWRSLPIRCRERSLRTTDLTSDATPVLCKTLLFETRAYPRGV